MIKTGTFTRFASHGFLRVRCMACDRQIGTFSTGYDWTADVDRCEQEHICPPAGSVDPDAEVNLYSDQEAN